MKKLLLVLTLTLFTTSHAFIMEKAVHNLIEQYNIAFNALKPYLPDIIVTTHEHWTYDSSGFHSHLTYEYNCPSPEVEMSLAHYQEAEWALNNKIMCNALGDGFMLGILAAVGNKLAGAELLNKKVIVPTIACAIALVLYQNHKLGTVPYVSAGLHTYDNQFDNVSFYTVGRILSMLASATVGYFGTSYTLTKIATTAQELSTNQNIVLEK